MNLLCYSESMLALLFTNSQNWATHSIQKVSDAEAEFKKFDHLFFDIDDTLNEDGLGLSLEVCELLNRYAKTHHVVLLTNCSQRRADQHAENIKKYHCLAELWSVGRKPNYTWLRSEVLKRGWSLERSAMFGDRPTMDLWCAYKAGFAGRFWVRSWVEASDTKGLVNFIKSWEWKLVKQDHV